jgi:hypothetical protein
MRQLVAAAGIGLIAVLAAPPDGVQAQEETCHICTAYNNGGQIYHFWPEWGGVVCDEPQERQENEDCTLRPVAEDDDDMPGYEGGCPDEDCPGLSEEEEALLTAAIDRDDHDQILATLRGTRFILHSSRSAIQLLSCSGTVVAHLPVDHTIISKLSAAFSS